MLIITPTAIPSVKIIVPKSFDDSRGSFCETYNRARFFEHGITLEFVQDNQSWSAGKGTIRGLHFQSSPMAQDKLVRVLRGRIFDAALDLRRSSPTYGRRVGAGQARSCATWPHFRCSHRSATLVADLRPQGGRRAVGGERSSTTDSCWF